MVMQFKLKVVKACLQVQFFEVTGDFNPNENVSTTLNFFYKKP